MISIVIPIYNAEKYLTRCVESIFMQSYKDFEIILVNDGSTDNSSLLCKKISSEYANISFFDLEKNGVSYARNYGIGKALGEFIFFMDADDTLPIDALRDLIYPFSKEQIDLTFANAIHIHREFKLQSLWEDNDRFFNKVDIVQLCKNFLDDPKGHRLLWSAWGMLFKKKIIVENRIFFNEKLDTYEDILFVFSYVSVCESIYYCAKSVYFYHYNQENIGSHFVVNNPLNFVCALKFIKEYLVKEHVKEIDILYGNAMVEYMILLMFQITRMQNIYSYISWKNSYNAINVLLQNQSGENNLSYYKQKHNDNFKIIPFLVKHKLVLFIIIVFKIQISLHKWRR